MRRISWRSTVERRLVLDGRGRVRRDAARLEELEGVEKERQAGTPGKTSGRGRRSRAAGSECHTALDRLDKGSLIHEWTWLPSFSPGMAVSGLIKHSKRCCCGALSPRAMAAACAHFASPFSPSTLIGDGSNFRRNPNCRTAWRFKWATASSTSSVKKINSGSLGLSVPSSAMR